MMNRLFRITLLWLTLCAPALATQATLVTPGPPLPMTTLASFLNAALLSVGSCNAGPGAPTNGPGGAAFAGQCWINTTSNPWVFSYTADGTHWSEFATLNTSSFVWQSFTMSSGVGGFGFSLANTESLTANRTLTVRLNDANRLLSLGGDLTTGGAFTLSGAFGFTGNLTGTTNVTFPIAGTLATLSGTETLINKTFNCASNTCTVRLGSDVTGTLLAASFPALTGDVSTSAGSLTTVLGNIPNATTAAGSILHTNIAAPGTPASGKTQVWTDSTDKRFHDKNDAGTIGTTVVADTGAANNFLTAISAAGAVSKARPACASLSDASVFCNGTSAANLTGTLAAGQFPALSGDVTTSAGSLATTIAANAVTNAKMATMAAFTLKANATGSSATPTDVDISTLTTKATPGAGDFLMISDQSASGALKKSPFSAFGGGGTSGAWTNTRLAKTAAYTTVTGDCGSTLALGGGAFFPATFNAPSGYTATCAFEVTDEDTAFGKLLVPQLATSSTSFLIGTGSKAFTTASGLPIVAYVAASARRYRVYSLANPANFMSGTVTSYVTTTLTINVDTIGGSGTFTDWQIAPEIRLWPGQSRMIYNQNNVWILDNSPRWKLSGDTEICADASAGSDSNDGLGVGTRCFQHIQFASNVVYQEWDANNFPPNIGLYTGPFNESVLLQGQLTGYNFLRYRTRAANTWTNTATCISIADNAEAIFDATFGFTQTWTCNTSNVVNTGAIFGHQVMVTDISGAHNWRPAGPNDTFLFLDGEGRATVNGTGAGIILGNGGTVSASSYVICNYHCSGVTTGGLLSYSGNVTMSGFYISKAGSAIDHSANPTNSPGTGTISPSIILGNSVLRENGLTPPGGAPTTSTGGQACATTC